MICAVLILDLRLTNCHSLKQKRSCIKPLINRLHKEFNVSSAEIDKNDLWDEAVIACGLISNEKNNSEGRLSQIVLFVEKYWKEVDIITYSIQFI